MIVWVVSYSIPLKKASDRTTGWGENLTETLLEDLSACPHKLKALAWAPQRKIEFWLTKGSPMRKWTIASTLMMGLWVMAPVSAHAEEKAAETTEAAPEEKDGTNAEMSCGKSEGDKKEAEKKESETSESETTAKGEAATEGETAPEGEAATEGETASEGELLPKE